MGTVTYVKSTDVGAISLYGQYNRFETWADKHLVTDGGWTKQAGSTGQANYRPPGQVRGLHIDHTTAITGSAATRVHVRAFESASAFGTVTDAYPTSSQVTDANSNIALSTSADTTARRWWMLRGSFTDDTDSFVFLAVEVTINATEIFFWGKLYPEDATDVYPWLITARNSTGLTGISFTMGTTASGGSSKVYLERSKNGAVKSTLALIPLSYNTTSIGVVAGGPAFTSSGGQMDVMPVRVGCSGSSNSTTNTANSSLSRGWLPSIWQPEHSSYSNVTNADTADDTAYDAASFRQIFGSTFAATSITGGAIVIETTNTWRPPGYP